MRNDAGGTLISPRNSTGNRMISRLKENLVDHRTMTERSSLPSKNFPCISMEMLQIGALLLLGRLVESIPYIARLLTGPRGNFSVRSPRGYSLLNNGQFMQGAQTVTIWEPVFQ